MFDTMRRLHPRGPANPGLAVDAKGAMLGPDCILVRRTAAGYRCLSHEEAATLQGFLLGEGRAPDWLFEQCRRIAKALDRCEIALAQILGLHIPIGDLDSGRLERLAHAALLIKANFNPDESRIPAGQPGGGEWTGEGGSPAEGSDGPLRPMREYGTRPGTARSDYSDDDGGSGGRRTETENFDPNLLPVAYQGYYHDEVVELLRKITIAGGGKAITQVPLTAIDGTTAIADMIVSLPGHGTFLIEVKTGENPQFTNSQRRIYPMVQIGGHVTSPKADLRAVDLTPGKPLPPLRILIYWAPAPGRPVIREWLPPPEFVP